MHGMNSVENEILILGILQKQMTKYHLTLAPQGLTEEK